MEQYGLMTALAKLEKLQKLFFLASSESMEERKKAAEEGEALIAHLYGTAKGDGFLSDEEYLERHAELFHKCDEPICGNSEQNPFPLGKQGPRRVVPLATTDADLARQALGKKTGTE